MGKQKYRKDKQKGSKYKPKARGILPQTHARMHVSGWIVTTFRERERSAEKDAMDLLETVCSRLYGPFEPDDDGKAPAKKEEDDIAAALSVEVNKVKKGRRRIERIDTMTPCYLLFRCNDKRVDPEQVVFAIFTSIVEDNEHKPSTQYILRLLPIVTTCYGGEAEVREVSKPWIAKWFDPNVPTAWRIMYNGRRCPKERRKEVIGTLAALVEPQHPVNLTRPTLTIFAEAFANTVALGCGKNFDVWRRYNLFEVLEHGIQQKREREKEEETTPKRVKT